MESKVCSQCKEQKLKTEFYKAKNKPGGYAYTCKQCSDVANKKTRDKHDSRYRGYRNDYKKRLNVLCNEYKMQRGCYTCGEKSHPTLLEMHHLDASTKEDDPSTLRTSWDRWLLEAEKCVVLCANCHRKVHVGLITI